MSEDPGVKCDQGKRDYSLMPWGSVEEVQKVLDFGAKKYARDNWKRVPFAKSRYFAAALRHIVQEWWVEGSKQDGESSCHPLAHAICCLLFLMEFDREGYPQDSKKPEDSS